MNQIAVLIPCYNEEITIAKVVADFKSQLPQASIYVYDNNSTDNTAQLARDAGAIVVPEPRQGKGNVIRSMFRDIEADCYIIVDGDDTYDASYAGKMADEVLHHQADMVIGDRLSTTYFEENKRPFHNMGNKVVSNLIKSFFHSDIQDIMTGYRAFSYLFVKSFPVLSAGFEIETEMTIHALDKRFVIREMAIPYRDRPEGSESKLNTVQDGIKVLKTIVGFFKNYRPLQFFSIFAAIFFLIGLGGFIFVLVEFFETQMILHMPTLVVAVFLMLAAMLAFVCGVVLDTIRKHQMQNYELWLNSIRERQDPV